MPPKPVKKASTDDVKPKKQKKVVEEEEEEDHVQESQQEDDDDPEPAPMQRNRSMTSPNVIEGGSIDIAKKKRSLKERLGFGSKKIELKKAPVLPPAPEADVLNKMFAKLLVKFDSFLFEKKPNAV